MKSLLVLVLKKVKILKVQIIENIKMYIIYIIILNQNLFKGMNAKMSDEDMYNIQKNFQMKKLIVKAKSG